jgi:hypothetical protein
VGGTCVLLVVLEILHTKHSAWKSGTLRQGPFTIVEQGPFISAKHLAASSLEAMNGAVRKSVLWEAARARLPEKRSPHFDFLTNKAKCQIGVRVYTALIFNCDQAENLFTHLFDSSEKLPRLLWQPWVCSLTKRKAVWKYQIAFWDCNGC